MRGVHGLICTALAMLLLTSGCASLNPFGGRGNAPAPVDYAFRPSLPTAPSAQFIPAGYPLRCTNAYVSSTYGMRHGRMHNGIDFAAATGTPVYATADGRVSFAGTQRGYGQIVCIEHANGYSSCYAHLSRFEVREGQWVRQGDAIGRVGATGNATGPHLHYEIRRHQRAVNPNPYLGMPPQQYANLTPR